MQKGHSTYNLEKFLITYYYVPRASSHPGKPGGVGRDAHHSTLPPHITKISVSAVASWLDRTGWKGTNEVEPKDEKPPETWVIRDHVS